MLIAIAMSPSNYVRRYVWRDEMLEVNYADAEQASQGDRIFDYHGMSRTNGRDTDGRTIDLSVSPSTQMLSEVSEPIARGPDGITLHLVESGLVLRVDDALMVTVSPGRIEAQCPPRNARTEIDRRLYYILTLGWLSFLQKAGFYGIHAAALGSPDGDGGVIMSGPSDSGKSTISLGLIRRGWKLLSDDSVLLFDSDGRVAAAPLRTDMGFDPEDVDRHHDLATAEDSSRQLTDAGKVRVNARAQFPDRYIDEFVPSILLMPVIAGEKKSVLTSASKTDAITGLMQQASFMTRDPEIAATQMGVLNRLVGQCRCYHLRSGTDLLDDPGLLAEMLASV